MRGMERERDCHKLAEKFKQQGAWGVVGLRALSSGDFSTFPQGGLLLDEV
jgi:hypothetical protein